MVRMRGLEPPRCHHHRLLRPARLPVPPHPQNVGSSLCECPERVSRMATGATGGNARGRNHDHDAAIAGLGRNPGPGDYV